MCNFVWNIMCILNEKETVETGWEFDTKEKAENFLKDHNFLKLNDSKWISKPTRGASKSPVLLKIEKTKKE